MIIDYLYTILTLCVVKQSLSGLLIFPYWTSFFQFLLPALFRETHFCWVGLDWVLGVGLSQCTSVEVWTSDQFSKPRHSRTRISSTLAPTFSRFVGSHTKDWYSRLQTLSFFIGDYGIILSIPMWNHIPYEISVVIPTKSQIWPTKITSPLSRRRHYQTNHRRSHNGIHGKAAESDRYRISITKPDESHTVEYTSRWREHSQ